MESPEAADELQSLQRLLADSIMQVRPLDEIRILFAQGARLNEPVTQGLYPLHYAVYQQYTECVELFLVRGCQLDLMDEIGYTPLHLAAERGYLEILRMLLEAGARVCFTRPKTTEAPLADEPLRLAINAGHLACAELLLRHGADANAVYFLGSELHLAASQAGSVAYMELLLRHGANTESRDRNGLTPLMRVAKQPTGYEAVKLLLRHGAAVNCYAPEHQDYRSVLHYAVLSGNLSSLRLLLFAGAHVAYPSDQLNKPSCLDFAILQGNLPMIKLLIEFGAQLNTGSAIIGLPLHVVLSEKIPRRMEIMRLLLEHGANPNLITVDQRGPLLKPPIGEYLNNVKQLQPAVVRTLLKYNARVICTAQVQHPLGILKCLNRLHVAQSPDAEPAGDREILDSLLEATERYNVQAISRCSLLNDAQRRYLLAKAGQPRSLKHMARVSMRRYAFALAEQVFTGGVGGEAGLASGGISRSNSGDQEPAGAPSDEQEDSYVLNRNAYKRYVGDRYQNYGQRSNRTLVCQHAQCEPDGCERLRFARACGLTTEEMQLLRERNHGAEPTAAADAAAEQTPSDSSSETLALPVGYRIPPGSDWPMRLIQMNTSYHDYHLKYSGSGGDLVDGPQRLAGFLRRLHLRESADRFKSAPALAVYLLGQLPLPVSLNRYLLYEE